MSKGIAANVMGCGILVMVDVVGTRKAVACEKCALLAGKEICSAPRLSRPIPRGPKVSKWWKCRPLWWPMNCMTHAASLSRSRRQL
eukprot:3772706-Amphidinium_carterae.1